MPKDIAAELIAALYGRSSSFVGNVGMPTERIVYHILHETMRGGKNIVWICLRDTPNTIFNKFSSYGLPLSECKEHIWFLDATILGDPAITPRTIRCASLDYVFIIIEVGKLLKEHTISFLMLDHIGILSKLDRIDFIVRPLKYLDSMIRAEGGGFVTMLTDKALPGSMEANLLGLIDVIINVDKENIQACVGSKELIIPFCFSGDELILGSDDREDLADLFSLTPEEKKRLEREVEEKVRLYG